MLWLRFPALASWHDFRDDSSRPPTRCINVRDSILSDTFLVVARIESS